MQPFTLFNSTHIISIVSTYLIIALILVWVSYQSKPIKKNAEVSIGVLLITHYFMQFFHAISFDMDPLGDKMFPVPGTQNTSDISPNYVLPCLSPSL